MFATNFPHFNIICKICAIINLIVDVCALPLLASVCATIKIAQYESVVDAHKSYRLNSSDILQHHSEYSDELSWALSMAIGCIFLNLTWIVTSSLLLTGVDPAPITTRKRIYCFIGFLLLTGAEAFAAIVCQVNISNHLDTYTRNQENVMIHNFKVVVAFYLLIWRIPIVSAAALVFWMLRKTASDWSTIQE